MRGDGLATVTTRVREGKLPSVVVDACRADQSNTTMPVLCPTLVPKPTRPGAPGTSRHAIYAGPPYLEMRVASPAALQRRRR